MMRALGLPTVGSWVVLAACASNPARQAADDCVLTSSDSLYIGDAPLYRECAVDRPAEAVSSRLVFDHQTGASPPPRPGVTCYTAEVEFVVGVDGRPEQDLVRLVRADDRTLGEALLASVPGWRYAPAVLDDRPVRQLVRERRVVAVAVRVTSSRGGAPRPTDVPPRCR